MHFSGNDQKNNGSKILAFFTCLIIAIMIFVGIFYVKDMETTPINIVKALPEGSNKIVLTQDLAKEHMVAYLNNRKAALPLFYGFITIIVVILAAITIPDVRRILIERRENYDEEDRGLSSFLNYRTIFLFGKVAMIIIVLFTFATAFKSMLGNKDPESQTPTIQTVTVTDKDIVTTYKNEEDETDFYLIFENGEKRRVSQSNYDDVQIDHTYYLGLTEQGNIFGIYDTDVYELPQGDK